MHRSDLALAALATAAVPGLRAVEVRAIASDGDDDVALVVDDERRRWIVRSPRDAASGADLEAEMTLLRSFGAYVDSGRLPFAVPAPAGFAQLDEGGRAVVYPEIPGTSLPVDSLRAGPGLARAVGQALAALHELPVSLVEDAGLPSYTSDHYRRRHLSLLDEAAATGRVPVRLLRRWETALEDVATWRFRPVVTHGDLGADHVLVAQQSVNGIVDWSSCQVADPADDLAWLVVVAPPDAVESVLEAYQQARAELTDAHLVDRAHLVSELALVRWLLHGIHQDDAQIQADAVEMMLDLDEVLHPASSEPAPGSMRVGPTGASLADAHPVEATEVADGTPIISGSSARSAGSARSAASGHSAVSAGSSVTGAVDVVSAGADGARSGYAPTAATEAIDIADARAAWAAYDDVDDAHGVGPRGSSGGVVRGRSLEDEADGTAPAAPTDVPADRPGASAWVASPAEVPAEASPAGSASSAQDDARHEHDAPRQHDAQREDDADAAEDGASRA